MDLVLGSKTYTANKVKTRMLRRAIEINEKIDYSNLKVKDLDELVDFVCELYGNEFTRDTFYDELEADKLVQTLTESINGILGGAAEKLNTFPAEQ